MTGPNIWASQAAEHRFDVLNPATGELLQTVQGGGADEVDCAVNAAHAGFESWRYRRAAERAGVMRAIANTIEAHADELATLEVMENGKPFAQARFNDVAACIGMFHFFAGLTEELMPRVQQIGPIDSAEHLCPLGVIAGIIPFNWPPIHFGGKVAPALAVGNAIVLKPGEQAPLTIMRLVEIVSSVLPDAVLHCVPGTGETGAALVEHPLVRKVSFTGAPSTGVHVLRSAAKNLTPSLMELGGKNPFIICADADLDLACRDAIEGAFINKGEACTAASRILVDRSVAAEVEARLSYAISRLQLGDGLVSTTDVGPVVSAAQKARVLDYIRIGRDDDGARLLAQGNLPDDPALQNGYFVPPTLFADVRPDMRIAQEEIFGPVTCIIPFDADDEAVAIANNVEFGLISAVYSRSPERAGYFANRIEAGMVLINNYSRNFMGSPFGGIKASGFGREHCIHTLYEFGYLKTVRSPSGNGDIMRWPVSNRVAEGFNP